MATMNFKPAFTIKLGPISIAWVEVSEDEPAPGMKLYRLVGNDYSGEQEIFEGFLLNEEETNNQPQVILNRVVSFLDGKLPDYYGDEKISLSSILKIEKING